MPTYYLSSTNLPIKINSARISNASSPDGLLLLSKRNAEDLNKISDYINLLLVPALGELASKPTYPYDTIESGLSGLTVITYPASEGNNEFNTELYWNQSQNRPCTVKESFDFLLSSMIDRVVEVRESLTNLEPLWDQIRCFDRKINQIKTDTFGNKYVLDCNSEPALTHSLSRHIREIIRQLTNNPNDIAGELDVGESAYPDLSLNVTGVNAATETESGLVEIATITEIAQAAGLSDSESNSELVVTADRLGSVLASDDANGNLSAGSINGLRNQIKTIANERIAASDIGALNNVSEVGAANGDFLVYNGSRWEPGNDLNATVLLGDFSTDTTIGDAQGRVTNNYDTVSFSKVDDKNVRIQSYEIKGLNPNYLFNEENSYKTDTAPGVGLRLKKVPFVLRSCPTATIYNSSQLELLNSSFNVNLVQSNYRGSAELQGIMAGNQARCTFYDDASQTHLIQPRKMLGVCRSDIEFGDNITQISGSNITNQITTSFDLFMRSSGSVTIQESGTSRLMVLGPHEIGDEIYICPEKILENVGIGSGVGVCISETFMNTGLNVLTNNAVSTTLSLFELFKREISEYFITTLNELEVKSKPMGIIVNKIESTFDQNTLTNNIVSSLCYRLLDSEYSLSNASEHLNYLAQELTEIEGSTTFIGNEDYGVFQLRSFELSLPLVKLTI